MPWINAAKHTPIIKIYFWRRSFFFGELQNFKKFERFSSSLICFGADERKPIRTRTEMPRLFWYFKNIDCCQCGIWRRASMGNIQTAKKRNKLQIIKKQKLFNTNAIQSNRWTLVLFYYYKFLVNNHELWGLNFLL